jgi:hypothetical protein
VVLLIAAVATGFGMWRVLMNDEPAPGPVGQQISQHDRGGVDALFTRVAR